MTVYLRSYLAAFEPWLARPDVTDILVNCPGEVWTESAADGMVRHAAPEVTPLLLERLAQQIAAASHQGVNRAQPLLAASLPDGARVQIIAPPATRGPLALAIRKHVLRDHSLDDLEQAGVFADTALRGVRAARAIDPDIRALARRGEMAAFLRAAVRARLTILISGGTGSGKTTLLNACLKETPAADRVIAIEDTPEIHLDRPNSIGLIGVKGDLGEARVSIDQLMQAALRMRPDRLLVGEVRGAEAFTFLRAINTGHPGSITTVHADSPRGALDQLAFMALQAGSTLTRADIVDYAKTTIDVVVQMARREGRRVVTEIAFTRNDEAPHRTPA